MNEYQERYRTVDNEKLFKIIEEAEKYHPAAVEAAQLELSKRKISEEEIQSIKTKYSKNKSKIEERQKQIKIVENKAKTFGTEFIETISPIQKEPQTAKRKINLIVIIFGLLAIFQLFKEFGMFQFMLTSDHAEWSFSMILYFLPVILLPIGVFLFWKRNKIGWILMSVFFVYNIVSAIGTFFIVWEWNKNIYPTDSSVGDFEIDFQGFEDLFPQPNPIVYVAIVIIFSAILWAVNQLDIRKDFKIDKKSAIITIGLSIAISSLIFGFI